MGEPETRVIKLVRPRREWLLRCNDIDNQFAVCALAVSNGDLEIYTPGEDRITFEYGQIAEFHAALHEAITLAETDLRVREERAVKS